MVGGGCWNEYPCGGVGVGMNTYMDCFGKPICRVCVSVCVCVCVCVCVRWWNKYLHEDCVVMGFGWRCGCV